MYIRRYTETTSKRMEHITKELSKMIFQREKNNKIRKTLADYNVVDSNNNQAYTP